MECRYVGGQNKVSLSCYEKYLGWERKGRERTKVGKAKSLASNLQTQWNNLGIDRRRKRGRSGKVEERKARDRERSQEGKEW